jgi:hypothetical protein
MLSRTKTNDMQETPTHLQAHFIFFSTHNANAEKNKKSLQANAPDSARFLCKLDTTILRVDRRAADNTGLAKVAVQCSADTFVVNQSSVLRIKFSGENRHLRQARNRQAVK